MIKYIYTLFLLIACCHNVSTDEVLNYELNLGMNEIQCFYGRNRVIKFYNFKGRFENFKGSSSKREGVSCNELSISNDFGSYVLKWSSINPAVVIVNGQQFSIYDADVDMSAELYQTD